MTEKEWGIIIGLYIAILGACGTMFWRLWSYVTNKKNGVTTKSFDEYKHEFQVHEQDFKNHKGVVQYKAQCEEIQKRITSNIDNNRELLEQKLESVQDVICAKIESLK